MNIVDSPTKRKLPARTHRINSVVVHSSGSTDLHKILAWYMNENGLQPHYFIAYNGDIYHIVHEDHIAYHCLIEPAEATAYQAGFDKWSTQVWHTSNNTVADNGSFFSGYATWRDEWVKQGIHSPLDLVTGAHPNSVSIGIELQQPEDADLTPAIFLDTQYAALAELLADVTARNQIPLQRGHILGHYDCSPMRRSNSKGSWDPGEGFDWLRALAQPTYNT